MIAVGAIAAFGLTRAGCAEAFEGPAVSFLPTPMRAADRQEEVPAQA